MDFGFSFDAAPTIDTVLYFRVSEMLVMNKDKIKMDSWDEGMLMGICMHQGQSKWILVSYSSFYASILLILLFWFISMSLHFSLYFSLFYFPLFTHLFATRHFTFASASRLRACPDISVRADYSAGICFCTPQLVCFHDSHVFASVRCWIIKDFPVRHGRSWNEGRLWSHREIMTRG